MCAPSLENVCMSGRVFKPWSLKCKSSPEVMCFFSRMWAHVSSILATLNAVWINMPCVLCVFVHKCVWNCGYCFVLCLCEWQLWWFVGCPYQLVHPAFSDLSFRGSVFMWMLVSPYSTLTRDKTGLVLSMVTVKPCQSLHPCERKCTGNH